MNNLLRVIIIATSSVLFLGCSQANKIENTDGLTMNKFDHMKNWCIGRYSFQVPKTAIITDQTSSDKYDSFRIKSELAVSIDRFHEEIARVEKESTSFEDDYIKDQTKVEMHGKTVSKIIWAHSHFAQGRSAVQVFAFVYDKSKRTLFKITGRYGKGYEAESIASIKYLVKNLSARNNEDIPDRAGVCIFNGFIQDDGKEFKYSNQQTTFKFKEWPSVKVTMETEATTKVLQNLIDRTTTNLRASAFGATALAKLKTLRKGEKNQDNVPALQGQEWIIKSPMKGRNGIDAKWEHTGTASNGLDPLIQLEVKSGHDNIETDSASISEQEAYFLYEKILNSIKKF
ncbi:T6SS immunity protein Tli4 family protein [Acinetobacter larvae]|uniref:Tle cognate immunity protein 4 C-terminal domain-containing protein n=1 Tax=Acinetobacter larvae TaxID=1789224 RepID=A0A1B2M332_9GAMM|nr:T6SS immunity protein Tli4 family protein [Acinetobacter larvae]AOA59605.1 hypothetical protein BFG52_15470 [Acinetobacter larvae]